jgi:hypothetical protein
MHFCGQELAAVLAALGALKPVVAFLRAWWRS